MKIVSLSKKIKIALGFAVSFLIIMLGLLFIRQLNGKADIYVEDGIQFVSKTEGRDFLIYKNGKWEKTFLTGVNIGATKPGHFPGELAITKEEYLRWFEYIGDMNADVIRVYTILKPDFYDALLEYNSKAKKPLYLIHGVWVNEQDVKGIADAYAEDEKIKNNFIQDTEDLIDVLHGNKVLPDKYGFASGTYTSDVSKYVVGWILGTEWDPDFVEGTDTANPERSFYSGKYLETKNASPFETFLCEVGDTILAYEEDNYQMTRALAFSNWLTTDMLSHPEEPMENEDRVTVNTEHIKATKNFKSGMFASYHVYPYYPEFLNYQTEYIEYRDETGKINTYRAYLKDLFKEHTVPVIVAEYGVPSARGKAHENLYSGYNQGNIDEKSQGHIDESLLMDIYEEGYCGAIVFTWQDEWFKRTWNTMDFDLPDHRAYWSNPQTNEQQFGLLAFDPGEEVSECYVDGDIEEWREETPVSETNEAKLYCKADEKYVYFMVESHQYDFKNDTVFIPIDIIENQGNLKYNDENLFFECPADFVIRIQGETESKIVVDAYYDSFYFIYAKQQYMIDSVAEYEEKNSGIFNPEYLCLNRELYIEQDDRLLPFSKYETGRLKYGDANPEHDDYNSLTDYAYKDGNLEIRIPWLMLNVMDPSKKSVISDMYVNGEIVPEETAGFKTGVAIVKNTEKSQATIAMNYYSWVGWDEPSYHERLKPSYYILKDAFKKIDKLEEQNK